MVAGSRRIWRPASTRITKVAGGKSEVVGQAVLEWRAAATGGLRVAGLQRAGLLKRHHVGTRGVEVNPRRLGQLG